ncbi:MAG: LacI family transcriptional regulator [Chryseobacterium sp.]|nr:MAG: LacI family transcriptional regulator [Chryseobacterium sp.]
MEKITLKQIAKELKLSTSTISRAISDDYQISKLTKEKILAHVSVRGYRVNRFAKALRQGKTMTIGVVICSLDNAFMVQVINGISECCKEMGYQLLIMQSRGSFEEEKNCLSMLVDSRVDGILISPSFNTTDLTYLVALQEKGIPIVLFDRINEQLKTHQVAVDNFNGGVLAATNLTNKGFDNFLVLSCQNDIFLSKERLKGFLKTLNRLDIPEENCVTENCDQTSTLQLEGQLEGIFKKIFKGDSKVEAIFATTDSLTITALKVLKKLSLEVPIVGFCNSDLAGILIGKLTTIVQPAQELGMLACHQLISIFGGNEVLKYQTMYLPTRVVEKI